MTIEQIVVLAIVQGITEFLPISSSGHLILVPALTGWKDQGLVTDVMVHDVEINMAVVEEVAERLAYIAEKEGKPVGAPREYDEFHFHHQCAGGMRLGPNGLDIRIPGGMDLQVTGKNLDVGDALRTYVTQRIEQAVDKFIGRSLPGHIRIEKERGNFRTDCSIQLKSGLSLQSRGEAPDAYASADLALERLEKRLRRYKRRLKNHHGPAQDVETAAPYYVIQAAEDEEETVEDDNPVIIAETETMIQVLPVSDAVMRMDVSDKPVLVFRNASHARLSMSVTMALRSNWRIPI